MEMDARLQALFDAVGKNEDADTVVALAGQFCTSVYAID